MVKAFTFIKDMQNDGRLVYPPNGYGSDFCNQLFVEQKVVSCSSPPEPSAA